MNDPGQVKIIESKSDLKEIAKGQVVSIGNFDGVHLGHQQIISTLKETAERYGTATAVMTFHPHPVAILHPEKSPPVLTPLLLKEHLLENFGVEILIVLNDSPELLNLSPQEFVDEFLAKSIRPRVVVEGDNFHFGRGRAGNIRTLQHLGLRRGFEVLEVVARQIQLTPGQDTTVSSSLIRELLQKGRVEHAAVALGRAYRLIGQVIPGRGRGAKLGFPTANITPSNQIIPAEGVYAGFVAVADACRDVCRAQAKSPAALSIGEAKTFAADHSLLVEAHILADNVPDLYGKWLAMDFIKHLRNQKKFETESQLAAQITKDCQMTKEILRMN